MSITLTGYNEFYDGWLLGLFNQPLPDNANESVEAGYKTAKETGLPLAFSALPAAIAMRHVFLTIKP